MVLENDITAPPPKKFSASYAKLGRARKHISELEQVIADHIPKNPIKFGTTIHSPDGVVTMPFTTPAYPKDAPVILGDIIHNCRVSLDLMASEIAKNKTGSDVGVYFPFSQDKKSLRQAIKGKKFSRCGSDAITLLETFSPYKGGNWELRELHDLDIMDKHKSLIPDPKLDVNPAIDYEKWEYLPGSEFNYQFTFPEESLFKGRELVSGSKGLVDLCEDILDAFASI